MVALITRAWCKEVTPDVTRGWGYLDSEKDIALTVLEIININLYHGLPPEASASCTFGAQNLVFSKRFLSDFRSTSLCYCAVSANLSKALSSVIKCDDFKTLLIQRI